MKQKLTQTDKRLNICFVLQMDKPKLVEYDTSLETDIEVTDEIVDNLDEVETQNAVETEHQPDTNLISMKEVIPDKIFKKNLTLPLKDFSMLPMTKDDKSECFQLQIDKEVDKNCEFDLKSPNSTEKSDE